MKLAAGVFMPGPLTGWVKPVPPGKLTDIK